MSPNQYRSSHFLRCTLLLSFCWFHCSSQQWTDIWFEDGTTTTDQEWTDKGYVYWDYDSNYDGQNTCTTGKCMMLWAELGTDSSVSRVTNVTPYDKVRLKYDLVTYLLESNDGCNIFYAYDSSSKQLATSITPPDSTAHHYTDQYLTFPSSTNKNQMWLWLETSNTNSDQTDLCFWDNIYLQGAVLTPDPTQQPSSSPTDSDTPSASPTRSPSRSPTDTDDPSSSPTRSPSHNPSGSPTFKPTQSPNNQPIATAAPSGSPTRSPSHNPSGPQTSKPSQSPNKPSIAPSPSPILKYPSYTPTVSPTLNPSDNPTLSPTVIPTIYPIESPQTKDPSSSPTELPSAIPTVSPTMNPTENPAVGVSNHPTRFPSTNPTSSPLLTANPTLFPSSIPTISPTINPSFITTMNPSLVPSQLPSVPPTLYPTMSPQTTDPSSSPTALPSSIPTVAPTLNPTDNPAVGVSNHPTRFPSVNPTRFPSFNPTRFPSVNPTRFPSVNPTFSPILTANPTLFPSPISTVSSTTNPSFNPTTHPSLTPSQTPSVHPTVYPIKSTQTTDPSAIPTVSPTTNPTVSPTMDPSASPLSDAPTEYPSDSPSSFPTSLPSETPENSGGNCDTNESLEMDHCDETDDEPKGMCSLLIEVEFSVCYVHCYKNKRSKLWNNVKLCLCHNVFKDTEFEDNKSKKCYIEYYHFGHLVNGIEKSDNDPDFDCTVQQNFEMSTGMYNEDCDYLSDIAKWLQSVDNQQDVISALEQCNLIYSKQESSTYPKGFGGIISGRINIDLRDNKGNIVSVNVAFDRDIRCVVFCIIFFVFLI